jgi:DNA-binding transcriptional ArsR family regulator
MVTGGLDGLLASMRPLMRWRPPVLEVDYNIDRDLHLRGRGLRFVPSYFCSRVPVSLADPELPPVLVYPIAQQFTWRPLVRPSGSLDKLVGPTRAAVLRAIGTGATTTQLARRLEASLASVSRHAGVLRDAGLVRSDRDGAAVLHSLTSLGTALRDAEQA